MTCYLFIRGCGVPEGLRMHRGAAERFRLGSAFPKCPASCGQVRVRIPSGRPGPRGETDAHAALRTRNSRFDSWRGHHALVAQRTAHTFPKRAMQVRLLPGAPPRSRSSADTEQRSSKPPCAGSTPAASTTQLCGASWGQSGLMSRKDGFESRLRNRSQFTWG